VRSIYEKKILSRRLAAAAPPAPPLPPAMVGEERRNSSDPWPDNPEIPDLAPLDLDADFPYGEFRIF
jgi:hypothetical protein